MFLEDEEANLQMKNVQLRTVGTEEQALHYHMMGSFVRRTAATCLNQASSRSHCIFTLNIRGKNLATLTEVYSKLHLVDLAGSERVSRSQAEGAVLTEARSINLSLTYLEQVIVSLNQKARGKAKAAHVPYRNSLLTTLLRDSLGGNCKTVMIATISTDRANLDETISTLRFAQRVKLVQNETTKNEKNPYSTRIDLLERENAQLRKRLAQFEGEGEQEDTEEDDAPRSSRRGRDKDDDAEEDDSEDQPVSAEFVFSEVNGKPTGFTLRKGAKTVNGRFTFSEVSGKPLGFTLKKEAA